MSNFLVTGAYVCIIIFVSLFFIKFGWSLFMVPVFHMQELTWMQALGLGLLTSTFRSTNTKAK